MPGQSAGISVCTQELAGKHGVSNFSESSWAVTLFADEHNQEHIEHNSI